MKNGRPTVEQFGQAGDLDRLVVETLKSVNFTLQYRHLFSEYIPFFAKFINPFV